MIRLIILLAIIAFIGVMLMRAVARMQKPRRPRPSDDELIRMAHPALAAEGFDLSLYRFKILEDHYSYIVTILGRNASDDVRQPANQNTLPSYEVVFDKTNLSIRRENYVS